ncbi:hypothetical protein [Actinomycetospora sp. TBRC 11914]|uniref:hypothetical protein n=1 Tax=Actinomycetospora sp. TBRC 11914 TaxID=2729387 RepID=UPI00145CBB3F|nr:hypothetical protein [Actinomycetospora sp. TBRC 11914]NMO91414.1 hypothetical protein [Actinomycetospora sp. TBRC 11914]
MTTTDTPPLPAHPDDPPTTRVPVPGLGSIELSRPDLVFVGGIAALGVLGLLEWPIALVMGAGHLLAADRSNRGARRLGEAMEEVA